MARRGSVVEARLRYELGLEAQMRHCCEGCTDLYLLLRSVAALTVFS